MKVALVCDWLTNVGGAEKVLLRLHEIYKDAPIYTSKYDQKGISWFKDADVRTGWLQIFPTKMRRFLGPLRQRWFRKLDLSEYDLVISVTGAEAKAVTAPNGKHISYCHVPTQYYWQMYDDYVKNPGFGILNPFVRVCFKALVKPLRRADFKAAGKVDQFVTISEYAKGLIKKYYKKEAIVVHPPVEVEKFMVDNSSSNAGPSGEGYYITTSRQVNWKRIDLAVEACGKLGESLLVIGEGPEHKKLVKLAEKYKTIKFVPLVGARKLAGYLAKARGYIFPSKEPFGIAPVEALAAGCPVIALGSGGALDYVEDDVNGVLFNKQDVKSLEDAILKFEGKKFERKKVAKTAMKFDEKRFDKEILEVVKKYEKNL